MYPSIAAVDGTADEVADDAVVPDDFEAEEADEAGLDVLPELAEADEAGLDVVELEETAATLTARAHDPPQI